MNFSFLTPENISTKYEEAKRHTELLTEPFKEFERISRNKPHGSIDPKYPKTTDGTTASILRKTPKRVVQQLPTGIVKSDDEDDWLPIVAEFIYTNKILPYANQDYDLIQKCWHSIENSMTFGVCATYTPFLNHNGYFCPDLTIPYWGDIFVQPGKKSGYSSNYVFMRAWWQPEDVEAIIDREKKLAKRAKERGEKYDGTWDIKALESILKAVTKKDDKAETPSEKDRNTNASGIELVTAFQTGIGGKFYTFNPSEEEVVRTEENPDPRGKMPINWLYSDIDGNNPLGRGIVELIGGLQNLIDSDMQMYQYNRALLLAPPVIKKGNFNKNKIVFEPHRIIDLLDQEGSIDVLKIDSSALQKYPELYGLQKSQLLNLVNSPDTSISADVGNPGFGKTPEALKAQKATISIDDNYVRKMFEAWFENWSEDAINLFFAKRHGVEELQLDKETADKLRRLAEEGKFDIEMLSEDNKIQINYDTATPALKFRVDASSSKMTNNQEQREAIDGLIDRLERSQLLQQIVPLDKVAGAWNKYVEVSGLEDPETMTVDLEEIKRQIEEQEQMQAAQEEIIEGEEVPNEEEGEINEEGAFQEAQPEGMPQEDTDLEFIEQLKALGLSDDAIQYALEREQEGATADQIIEEIVSV